MLAPGSAQGEYEILARAQNEIIRRKDPSAHAELLAIQEACKKSGSERLPEAILISTLEPCLLCSGAIALARIKAVHYLACITSGPGLSSVLSAFPHPALNHYPEVNFVSSLEERAGSLLRRFFQARREII